MLLEKIYDNVTWIELAYGVDAIVPLVLGAALLVAVVSYFLGCFNGAVIVSKYILHDDVRKHGSGNAGLTNFHRTFGGKLAAVVILCDALKAVFSVLFGVWILGHVIGHGAGHLINIGKLWGGLFCLLGHSFPCMFQFKGGKGVLSGGVVAFMMDWRIGLIAWGGFLILVVLTRWVSLGSIWGGGCFPFAVGFFYQDILLTVLALLCGGLLVIKHHANIKRILKGTESKFSFHRKKEAEQ